jgi:D-alanyl-D-alanine carboxypeptidase/D-alanyl-D-alanine-endopeptidase (penicillin-binding protein 4)
VRWQPHSATVRINSRATTVAPGTQNLLWLEPGDGPTTFKLRGTIALDSEEVLRTTPIKQPALVAARYLKEALERGGVVVEGTAATQRRGPAHYKNFTTLASHTSAPLGAALRVILKTSQNLHATMLPVLIGALRGERGDRYAGFRVIASHLQEMGVEPSQAVFTSGSGGGREDHASARWLVGLLRALAERDDFPTLLDALPVGGVDGTLAAHFRAADLVGRVRAKTGTLLFRSALDSTWVYVSKALAGYIGPSEIEPSDSWRNDHDDKLVFAILIHGTRARQRSEATAALFAAQEDIVRAVLRHPPNN